MTIPNALAFARNYQIPNTKLSPPLLLHCAVPALIIDKLSIMNGIGHR